MTATMRRPTKDCGPAARRLAALLDDVRTADSLNRLRGLEGESASGYFSLFNDLIAVEDSAWRFTHRSRRPPLDPVNSLLSFLYSMLTHDARSACEAAGLDAAVGFLHRDRPGRPGLALDLMEEFRPFHSGPPGVVTDQSKAGRVDVVYTHGIGRKFNGREGTKDGVGSVSKAQAGGDSSSIFGRQNHRGAVDPFAVTSIGSLSEGRS